jgi:bleomycin hydrolase
MSIIFGTILLLLNNLTSYLPYQLPLQNNALSVVSRDLQIVNENPFLFNHEISSKLPITDQKSSGRCWLFASLNLARSITHQNWVKEYNINDLEFSENYLYFYDKLERYHRNLRYFTQLYDDQLDNNNYMIQLMKDPLGDGGQWDMAKELILKYGLVPKSVMPDTYHSKSSKEMNKFLTDKLKRDFNELSKLNKNDRNKIIKNMTDETYNYLVGFLGRPPEKFDFVFNSNDKVISFNDMTPLELLEKTKFKASEWIVIINDPRKTHPYYKYYQLEYMGNVYDRHVGWVNLPIERLIELTKQTIDDNQPVWFGCDVGTQFDRETGIMHSNILDYKKFLNYENKMNKEERLSYYLSLPNHAMLITAYHEKNKEIKRWKIENSWGKNSGNNGYLLMTNDWFKEYVYQVIIHKSRLNSMELGILDTKPCLIPPWDPLGTLA